MSANHVYATSYSYITVVDCKSEDGYLAYGATSLYGTARNSSSATAASSASTTMIVGQLYSGSTYTLYRGYLYFDTSYIPEDATIDNVTLSLNITSTYTPVTHFNLSIQNGQPTYPHSPLVISDYYTGYYSGDGGNVSTSVMSGETYTNITFTDTALDWINIDGTTKLCIRSDDDINNSAPTTQDIISIYTTEEGLESSPKLYIGYSTDYAYTVNLYGPYTEDGLRDYDGINCTFTRPNQEPVYIELNGTYASTAQTDTRLVITSDIGNNYTRIYYLRYNQWYEDIYIFYPDDIYATYYITLVDFVGVSNAYLESILNINGTDRIIERQRADAINEIPFILSWGTSYKFRLVCDEGTYVWQSLIAGSDTSLSLSVTTLAFPLDQVHIGNITLSATRIDDNSINVLYDDEEELTDWVYLEFTEIGESTAIYYTNNTGSTQNITWSDALPDEDYIVYFEIEHQEEGTLTYSILVAALYAFDNPWDFSWVGDWGVIDSTQIIGVVIVLAVFGGFSIGSVDAGIIATMITAGILIYIEWLNIDTTLYIAVFCLAVIGIISIRKHQEGAG